MPILSRHVSLMPHSGNVSLLHDLEEKLFNSTENNSYSLTKYLSKENCVFKICIVQVNMFQGRLPTSVPQIPPISNLNCRLAFPCLFGHLLLVCLYILLHVVQDDVLSMEGELEVEVHGADSKDGVVAAPYLDTVATRKLKAVCLMFQNKGMYTKCSTGNTQQRLLSFRRKYKHPNTQLLGCDQM